MDVNSLPKTVTRQRRDCDLNPGPSAPESSMLTTRLLSHPVQTLTLGNTGRQAAGANALNPPDGTLQRRPSDSTFQQNPTARNSRVAPYRVPNSGDAKSISGTSAWSSVAFEWRGMTSY